MPCLLVFASGFSGEIRSNCRCWVQRETAPKDPKEQLPVKMGVPELGGPARTASCVCSVAFCW